MIREYEVWHHRLGDRAYTKWATFENRDEAIAMADEHARSEPGRLWEVYEVTSERIHNVEIPTPADQR